MRTAEFASPGPLRERLVEAVLAGEKTATSSLLRDWELSKEPLPSVGEQQMVVDSHGRPTAIIEIVGVDVIRLGDADERLAFDEGEGFGSVDEWRKAHESFWTEQNMPSVQGHGVAALDEDTSVVVERFRLVTRLST
jgi:uncharacterized protein YhfF